MAVPNTFASATSAIPLANLDANFAYYDAGFSLSGSAVTFAGAITLTSGTANGVPYLNASKVLTSGGVLTFNGTILTSTGFAGPLNGTVGATTANTGAFTTLTTSSTVTLNGGTANGVAYLDGSKVLTTGSALTFDGTTTLGLTVAGTGAVLNGYNVTNGTASGIFKVTGSTYSYRGVGSNVLWVGGDGNSMYVGTSTDQPLLFGTNAFELMRLTSSGLEVKQSQLIGYSSYAGLGSYGLAVAGNVGIGTASPAALLHLSSGNGTKAIWGTTRSFTVNRNWQVAVDEYAEGQFTITPSTTLGGTTFTTPAIRIDTVGNLGLGVTPNTWTSYKALQVNTGATLASTANQMVLGSNWYFNSGDKYLTTDYSTIYIQNSGQHKWFNAPSGTADAPISFTQAMTLDASGNLLVGLTTAAYNAERLTVYKSGNAEAAAFVNDAGANNYTVAVSNRATTGDNKFMVFATESSDTTRGSIVYNRAAGLTTYSTTSDYRAKDIIGPVTDSGALIDATPVYMGKMKGATQERPMFIAHETPAYAHTGVKDAVDADGKPVYQQMDASALIPVMWAEIQDLRKRLAAAGI